MCIYCDLETRFLVVSCGCVFVWIIKNPGPELVTIHREKLANLINVV